MRKTVIILSLLCLHAIAMEAQRITHRFSDTPLTEALTTIAQKAHDYRVHFVENELGGFRVTTFVKRKNALDAINQVIGTYPLKVTVDSTNIFVERIHRDWDNVCGTLVDNRRGSAVKYADIWLLNQQDSTTLTEGMSDGEGGFNIACREDSFLMRIWAIGYAPLMRHAQLGYIGVIPLEPNAIMLNEVKVQGLDVEHHGDRDVIYISDEMREGAVNTGDLLGKLQGFNYDRGRQKLSYYGKENIMVLVDSLEKDLDYVTNLHHLRWNKLDVIPFPKGRYEGYDVLVNLHTREDYRGYDNNGWGFTGLSPKGANMLGRLLSEGHYGESFTYTYNKWNFSVNYEGNFSQMRDDVRSETQYLQNDYAETVIANPDGSRNTALHERLHKGAFTIDHQFSERSSASVTYKLQWESEDSTAIQTVARADLAGNPKDTVGVNSQERLTGYRNILSAMYRGGKGDWNYTADFEYTHDNFPCSYDMQKTSGYATGFDYIYQMNQTRTKAEVNRHIYHEKVYLALTYENYWSRFRQTERTTGEGLANFMHLQNTLQLYAAYDFSRTSGIRASAAMTANHQTCHDISERYLTWKGSVVFTKRFKKNSWMHVNYNCTDENPEFLSVTPYGYYTDSLRYVVGNPLLHTGLSHSAMLDFYFLGCIKMWARYDYAPRAYTYITTSQYGTLQNGEQGYYAYTQGQSEKYNWFEACVTLDKWFHGLHICYQVLYDQGSGWYHLDGVTQRQHIRQVESNWLTSYDIKRLGNLRIALNYNNDRFYDVSAQDRGKQHFDEIWGEVSRTFFHDKVFVALLYQTPLHIIHGSKTRLLESPAYVQRTSQLSYNKRFNNWISIRLTYSLNGGKVVKNYRRRKSND